MGRVNRLLLELFFLPFILVFAIHSAAQDEGRRRNQVIQIPRLTVAGQVPETAARPGSYFFLDEASGDLVLSFPADLSEENFWAASDKAKTRARVQLAIGVRPTIETLVTGEPGFTYEYRLGNESRAKQIEKWVLGLPAPDEGLLATRVPAGWDFETWSRPDEWVENELSVMNLIPGAPPIAARDLVRNQARWWYRGLAGSSLEPGVCCLTFALRSRNLPGILTAYVQGAAYKVWAYGAVPDALTRLLPAFNFIETNSVSMPVIGPKFEPTALPEARVCDLLADVQRLVDERRLNETPAVGTLLAFSAGCLQRSPEELAAALQRASAAARDPFEREILSAIEINLLFR